MILPPEVRVQLFERDALDPPAANTRRLEHEVKFCEFRVTSQPCLRPGVDAPHLLFIDHLERVPVLHTSLLLHLDHEQSTPAAKDEVELIATHPRVGIEKPVAAKSIVPESAPFAAIHAAS
jgi:hypothetical protein